MLIPAMLDKVFICEIFLNDRTIVSVYVSLTSERTHIAVVW